MRGNRIRLTVFGGILLLGLVATVFAFFALRSPASAKAVVANVDQLSTGLPINWEDRVWVIRDGYGTVHAFPTTYEWSKGQMRPVRWLSRSDELARTYLDRDACTRAAGEGIFNVYSPANSRYDATGLRLFGPDRERLDWYDVEVTPTGSVQVDLGHLHRVAVAGGTGTATPRPLRDGNAGTLSCP
jgi:hypothetical protein